MGDEAAEAALSQAAQAALSEAALSRLRAEGDLGGGGFGRLILQGIRYMFRDRLVDGIGLFRRDVLCDLRVVADMVLDEF